MGIRRLIRGKGRRTLALLAAAGLLAACAGLVLKLRPDLAVRAELRLGRLAGGVPLTPVDYGEPWLNLVPLSSIRQGKTSYTYSWDLLLINPDHPLPADAAIPLSPYKDSGLSFYTGLNQPLSRLIQTVREETGDTLYVASGLRSAEEQAAEYRADPALAMPPGASEHQSGLALDVYVEGYAGYGFLKSAAGRYVNKECWREGFVIRYPDGGEDETGAPFEPWHLRYVGTPHAEILHKNGWTLEGYIERLEPYRFYTACGYFLCRQTADDGFLRIPVDWKEARISPDNTGGYILTGKV